MGKWYEVKSVEVKYWLVEVDDNESEDDAVQLVEDEMFSDADDSEVECIAKLGDEELDITMRHTDISRILDL